MGNRNGNGTGTVFIIWIAICSLRLYCCLLLYHHYMISLHKLSFLLCPCESSLRVPNSMHG
ncbi:hypothetical protein BJX68DRAFT_230118 [Aspergillus pseudodeflectus]|uniref:Uncharacterized protein n=1 Tax=Aspergillus pseudodeflectus TaxID=176178 RepID=A0ABR4KV72_9EURO